MKRILSLIAIALTISSCTEKKIEKREYKKVDQLLNVIFKDSFPNYKDNDLVLNKAFDYLKKNTDSILENNILDDLPLEIFKIRENPRGSGAIIHFVKHPIKNTFFPSSDTIFSDFITFDLLAATSEEVAEKLSEKDVFYIKSRSKTIDINTVTDLFFSTYYYENHQYIRSKQYGLDINFGVLFTEIDSLIPYNKHLDN